MNRKSKKLKDKIKVEKDIKLDISQIKKRQSQNSIALVFIAVLSISSSYLGFAYGFGLKPVVPIVVAIALIFSIAMQWTLKDKKRYKIGFPVISISIVAFSIITISSLINGVTGISNQIITSINENMAEAHGKYIVSSQNMAFDQIIATIVIVAIFSIIFNFILKYKLISMCVVLTLGPAVVNMIYKGEGQVAWIILALVSIFMIIYFSNIRIAKTKHSLTFLNIIGVVVLACSGIFVLVLNYSGIRSIDDLKDEIVYHAGNVIYGKSDYPEGQFKRYDKVELGDENVRLNIEMTIPTSLHLKGYVGCKYTDKGWTGNDEDVYGGKYTGMMDWFISQGYYPLTQPAYYMEYSVNNGLDVEQIEENNIHINNETASKKYEYVPENLLDMSDLISPKQDVNFIEQDLIGEKDYWYDIVSFKEDDYLKFPLQSWFEDGSKEGKFVDAVNVYREFANEIYLDVPQTEKQILSSNIPTCSNNISDAISTVRMYLKNQIEYSENCKPYNSDENYLEQILLDDRKGYSVHFATVATLMFRYYGIPARYVEGYYVPNDMLDAKVEVKDIDAHAWVEIYLKGFGFIPIEVTPGFYHEDEMGGGSSKSNQEQSNGGGGGGSSGTEKDEEMDYHHISVWMVIIVASIILSILAVLTIIFLIVRRLVVLKKRKEILTSDNNYSVVAEAGSCISEMCKFAKLDLLDEIESDIYYIFIKTKFSNDMLKSDETEAIVNKMNMLQNKIWSKEKVFRKLEMMFIYCLR